LKYQFRKEIQEEQEEDQRLREADQKLHQELPGFDGHNVSAWIRRTNQIFYYHRSPMYARVYLASFHMRGEALISGSRIHASQEIDGKISWMPFKQDFHKSGRENKKCYKCGNLMRNSARG